MEYFKPDEFQGYYDDLDPALKTLLDAYRARLGWPVYVSRAPGAVGRRSGPGEHSRHNIDKWGAVQACDLGADAPLSAQYAAAVLVINELGFGAVGVYPFWKPRPGIHLDCRPLNEDGSFAKWGDIGQGGKHQYVGVQEAFKASET